MPQPVTYYIQNEPTGVLTAHYGQCLDKLTAQQKCLMVAIIADHMASAFEYYSITESCTSIDPDCILGENLWDCIKSIADESDAGELAGLLSALSALIADDARNGAFE